MRIVVDGSTLEFKLENEKNLGDVLESLGEWVRRFGNVIDGVYLDGGAVPLVQVPEELSRDIGTVDEVRIVTVPNARLALDTLASLGDYIRTLTTGDLSDPSGCEEIIEGLSLIIEGVRNALGVLNVKPLVVLLENEKTVDDVLRELGREVQNLEKRYPGKEDADRLKKLLNGLLTALPKSVKWATLKNEVLYNRLGTRTTGEVVNDLLRIARRTSEKFTRVGENLQTGHDLDAVRDLNVITEVIDEIIYVLRMVLGEKGDVRTEEDKGLFKKLSECLSNVEGAFKNGDMITVGDLIEYDLKGLFTELIGLCEVRSSSITSGIS